MKTRFSALLLAVCLLTTTTLAQWGSTDNFRRTQTYAGQFYDLDESSVFYSNVSALYEYGLTVGKGNGTFGVGDSLTVGQCVIFAARIHSLYRTGISEPDLSPWKNTQPTALPYLLYLWHEGIPLDIDLNSQLTHLATRAQMAHILANTLPETALPDVHSQLVAEAYATHAAITDVTEYTPYQQDILALYTKGVSIGSDAKGSFYPTASITRGAAAAMLTRMVDPSLRVAPQWTLSIAPSPAAQTLAGLVSAGVYIATPATDSELESSIRYMLAANSNTLDLYYPSGLSADKARQVMNKALSITKNFCEQSYNSVECSYSTDGEMTLTFASTSAAGQQLTQYRTATMDAALTVREQLWSEGYLREGMSEKEIAEVYYVWVCENCTYDNSSRNNPFSHLPYSLFQRGIAVCDGYTGAYNLFLKLEGIECGSALTDDHIWTVAVLDGTEYHIDTTWGDSGDQIDYTYFAMTPEMSAQYHEI